MVVAVQYLERVPVWSLLLALARPSPSSSYLQCECDFLEYFDKQQWFFAKEHVHWYIRYIHMEET